MDSVNDPDVADVDLTDQDWKSRALAAEAMLIAAERAARIGLQMFREEFPDVGQQPR